jgi:hypothetical protein
VGRGREGGFRRELASLLDERLEVLGGGLLRDGVFGFGGRDRVQGCQQIVRIEVEVTEFSSDLGDGCASTRDGGCRFSAQRRNGFT